MSPVLRTVRVVLAAACLAGPCVVAVACPASAQDAPVPERVPPRLIEAPDPAYPTSHHGIAIEPVVQLHVTIEVDGHVGEAHVEHPGDPEFDAAALETVQRWRFSPGMRAGVPVRSGVRVEVRFHAPPPEPTAAVSADAASDAGPAGSCGEAPCGTPPAVAVPTPDDHGHPPEGTDPEPPTAEPPTAGSAAEPPTAGSAAEPEAHFGAHATADPTRAHDPRSASEYRLDRAVLDLAPHRDAGDLLSSAPGVYVARPEGDAVAQQIYLRGFDAEHGQDIELTLGGMPLNQPSHIHGQGYADLGFIVPEVVRSLRVTEGVYDPRQGDFATAGSIDFDLGVRRRGVQLRTTYGSFDTLRALVLWAPVGEPEETFGAVTYRRSSGFGRNRAGQSAGALGQVVLGSGAVRGRLQASLWAARYALAGVLRRDDVLAGNVDFLGVYDDPSARSQSALSARGHLGGTVEVRGEGGAVGELGAYVQWSDFRLQANYTGYVEHSTVNPDWVGRGDLVEQRNEALTLGLRGRYRAPLFRPFAWARGFVEAGLSGRVDSTGQAQNLLQAPQNETWDRRVDASLRGVDLGGYVDLDWLFAEVFHLRGGVRADALFYDVDDRLGNARPAFRRETYIVGFRRSAAGLAAGPRVSLEVTPIPALALSFAYGEGYRSPQARQLQDGETAPFAKVRSGDFGIRVHAGDHEELTLAASGYMTSVSDDTAFDPREGRLERLGPSLRIGGAVHAVARPLRWLTGAVSVTYVRATLEAPPPPSIDDPSPPYRAGELLPYVPPWVVRADVGANERLFDLDGKPLRGRMGAGFSFLAPRPLPYGLLAEAVSLLDVSAGASWDALDLSVEVMNVLDARYAGVEYSYASSWAPDALSSRIPARHFAAGAPLTVSVTLGVTL